MAGIGGVGAIGMGGAGLMGGAGALGASPALSGAPTAGAPSASAPTAPSQAPSGGPSSVVNLSSTGMTMAKVAAQGNPLSAAIPSMAGAGIIEAAKGMSQQGGMDPLIMATLMAIMLSTEKHKHQGDSNAMAMMMAGMAIQAYSDIQAMGAGGQGGAAQGAMTAQAVPATGAVA